MIALSELGEISKRTRGVGVYDPVFAAQQAAGPPPRPGMGQRLRGVANVPKKRAALIGAGVLTAGAAGEALRRDIKSQREVNRQYPYPNTIKGRAQRSEHRGGVATGLLSGGLTGAYIGHGIDRAHQAKKLTETALRAEQWEASRKAHATAPNMNESFRNEKERSRVARLRAMRTSHNPHEKDTAERMLRGMGRPLDEPTRPPWEHTKEGKEYATHQAKFKRRYGVGFDAPGTPENVRMIRGRANKLAFKRGAAIGAAGLGTASWLAARHANREERRGPQAKPYRNASWQQSKQSMR